MLKTTIFKCVDPNRDQGKEFLITEMPSAKAEKWATRMLLLAAQCGADVGSARAGGMTAIAVMGIQTVLGGVRYADLEPLLDEMMTCVQFCPDPARPGVPRPGPVMDNEIEEVATRFKLRAAIFHLHVGFSIGDCLSNLTRGAQTRDESPTMSMSPESSAQ